MQAAVDAGLAVDDFAPRLSFFFNVSNDFFEEVAKFRAARSIWAEVMRDRFGARPAQPGAAFPRPDERGDADRAAAAQQRGARVAAGAGSGLGGTQSLHTNSYDEALALPSQQAAEIALRTQQVIGFESGAAAVADPLGGSYLVERLTADLVEASRALMSRVEERGGAVSAIEEGFYQHEIQDSAYRHQQMVESGERVIVGVNRFTESSQREVEILRVGAELEAAQVERLEQLRARRDAAAVTRSVDDVRRAAEGTENLLPVMRDALEPMATVGEICNALRDVFGVHRPGR